MLSGTPTTTLQLLPAPGQVAPAPIVVSSFQFRVSLPGTVTSPGIAQADTLQVTAPVGAQTPGLFQHLTSSASYPAAVLTQSDAQGRAVASWALGTVAVVASATATVGPDQIPLESLQFSYASVTESTASGSSSWDFTRNTAGTPAVPPALAALPAAATTASLALTRSDGSSLTLPLDSFQFGFSTTYDPRFGPGKAASGGLSVAAAFGAGSPGLLSMLTAGTPFKSAVLTQSDAQGRPVASWALGTVVVAADAVSGGDGALPRESLRFAYASVTESTAAGSASWDFTRNTAGTPAVPPALAALPAAATTASLALTRSDGSTVALPLDSFQFGFTSDASNGQSGAKTTFDALSFSTEAFGPAPALLAALTRGTSFATAELVQVIAGQPALVLSLGRPVVIGQDIAGDSGGGTVHSGRIAFVSARVTTASGSSAWSQATNNSQGADIPPKPATPVVAPTPGLQFAPYFLTLTIPAGAAGNAAPIDVPLKADAVAFGVGRTPDGKISFDDLTVDLDAYQAGAPQLFALLTGGQAFSATLTDRSQVAEVDLGPVGLLAQSFDEGGMSLTLRYGALRMTTATDATAWSVLKNSATVGVPAGPSSTSFVPYNSAYADRGFLLQLTSPDPSVPALKLELSSFSFSFAEANGKASPGDLIVGRAFDSNDPRLIAALTTGPFYTSAVLSYLDYPGHPIASWAMAGVSIVAVDTVRTEGRYGTIDLRFSSITQQTIGGTASWDFTKNNAGPAVPTVPAWATVAVAAPILIVAGGAAYDGTPHAASGEAAQYEFDGRPSGSVAGTFTYTYDGSPTPPTRAGTYTVVATFTSADPYYSSGQVTTTLVIARATPTLAVGGTFAFDGRPHAATATALGVGSVPVAGTFTYTYDGSAAVPTRPGTYVVVATFLSADPNYAPAKATGTLVIKLGTDLTGSLRVAASGLVLNRSNGLFYGTITLTNTSASALTGPLVLALGGLTAGVELVNASGTIGGGPDQPYLIVDPASLAPGQSVTIQVVYRKPTPSTVINYVPKVYSGLN